MPEERLITIGAEGSTWRGTAGKPLFRRDVRQEVWTPNLDRIYATMAARNLDGIVALLVQNVMYLAGYDSPNTEIRHYTEPCSAVVISRHQPDHPIFVIEATDVSHLLSHPTWIGDIRTFLAHLLAPDQPRDINAFDRFADPAVYQTTWGPKARESTADSLLVAVRQAIADLGLSRSRIGIDHMSFAGTLIPEDAEAVDAYSTMKYIRQVKTAAEIERLRKAARLNEIAIDNTVRSWSPGMTWFEINHVYDLNCIALGGWVTYGGGIALSNADSEPDHPVFHPQHEMEDFPVEPGAAIMLDCHGQLGRYRWDGGKTWVVDDTRQGTAALIQRACEEASRAVMQAMKPGVGIHEVQMVGRKVFHQLGVPEADLALVFFHGMGLDHTDVEIRGSGATANWKLEENMVIATHIAYPGDARTRYYIEDVGVVGVEGGTSLFTWDLSPHQNR